MNTKLQVKFNALANLYRHAAVKPSAIAVTPEEFDALCDVFAPYTQAELEEAFNWVKPDPNWKLPIDCQIAECLRDRVDAAINHFVGGGAKFTRSIGGLRVTAPGYYATIGA